MQDQDKIFNCDPLNMDYGNAGYMSEGLFKILHSDGTYKSISAREKRRLSMRDRGIKVSRKRHFSDL